MCTSSTRTYDDYDATQKPIAYAKSKVAELATPTSEAKLS
jgi:hypothetical protein